MHKDLGWASDNDVPKFGLDEAETSKSVRATPGRVKLCPDSMTTPGETRVRTPLNLNGATRINPGSSLPRDVSGRPAVQSSYSHRHGPARIASAPAEDSASASKNARSDTQSTRTKRARGDDSLQRYTRDPNTYATRCAATKPQLDIVEKQPIPRSIASSVHKGAFSQQAVNNSMYDAPILGSRKAGRPRKPKEGDKNAPIFIEDDSEEDADDDTPGLQEQGGAGSTTYRSGPGPGECAENVAGDTDSSLFLKWRDDVRNDVFGSAGLEVPFLEMYTTNSQQLVTGYLAKYAPGSTSASCMLIQTPIKSIKFTAYNFEGSWDGFNSPMVVTKQFADIKSIRWKPLGTLSSCNINAESLLMLRFEFESAFGSLYIVLCQTAFDAVEERVRKIPDFGDKLCKDETTSYLRELCKLRESMKADVLNPCRPPSGISTLLERTVKTRSTRIATTTTRWSQDLTGEKDDFTDDTRVLFVFPFDKRGTDPITVTVGDKRRLFPGEWLNDNLIDLKIKFFLHNVDVASYSEIYTTNLAYPVVHPPLLMKDSMYAFSCHFYTALKNDDSDRVRAMIKVNIFEKDFIFIPINDSGHWSLACLVRPRLVVRQLQENAADGGNQSCLVHLDSLKMHKDRLLNRIYIFLGEEMRNRYGDIGQFSKNGRLSIKTLCPTIRPIQASQQQNGFDCGIYVIKYVSHIANYSFLPTEEHINSSLQAYFQDFVFSEEHAAAEREEFLRDISLLSCAYESFKKSEEERKKNRRELSYGNTCEVSATEASLKDGEKEFIDHQISTNDEPGSRSAAEALHSARILDNGATAECSGSGCKDAAATGPFEPTAIISPNGVSNNAPPDSRRLRPLFS